MLQQMHKEFGLEELVQQELDLCTGLTLADKAILFRRSMG